MPILDALYAAKICLLHEEKRLPVSKAFLICHPSSQQLFFYITKRRTGLIFVGLSTVVCVTAVLLNSK